jgi:integrase
VTRPRVHRSPGEGSIYQRKDGWWVVAVTVGYTQSGNPKRKVAYARTREEALRKMAELQYLHHKGLLANAEAVTVRDWVAGWLERKAKEVRPRTLEGYRFELRRAIPSLADPNTPDPFGSMNLQRVQPLHVRRLLDGLKVSDRSLKMVRWLLHAAFEEAVAYEVIHRNPVAAVKLRRGRSREKPARVLQPEEVRRLLEALDALRTPLALALRLMLACGLRRGEALALTWEDVDLERGLIHVRRSWGKLGGKGVFSEPKTLGSRRTVPVPNPTLERLRAYWEKVAEGFGEEEARRLFLFPGRDPNRPVDPDAPNHLLARVCRRAGLPPIRVHDLRHTYGSLLLARGAPLELVSERMGHANPTITLGIYRHLLDEERREWVVDPEEPIAIGRS